MTKLNEDQITGFVGEGRRSRIISTMGSGAIVDLVIRPGGEPVSGVVMGIEFWDQPEFIRERRLEKKYNVAKLGMPPVRQEGDIKNMRTVPVARLPGWLQSAGCKLVKPAMSWSSNRGNIHHAGKYCLKCKDEQGKATAVVPVRFVVACEHGHLDDFPWQKWIGCDCIYEQAQLKLIQRGPGLSGLHLLCTNDSCPGSPEKPSECFWRRGSRSIRHKVLCS